MTKTDKTTKESVSSQSKQDRFPFLVNVFRWLIFIHSAVIIDDAAQSLPFHDSSYLLQEE